MRSIHAPIATACHAAAVGPADGPRGEHPKAAPPPLAFGEHHAATVAAATSDHGPYLPRVLTQRSM